MPTPRMETRIGTLLVHEGPDKRTQSAQDGPSYSLFVVTLTSPILPKRADLPGQRSGFCGLFRPPSQPVRCPRNGSNRIIGKIIRAGSIDCVGKLRISINADVDSA